MFYIFEKYFRAFPFEIAKNMKWRGSRFEINSVWFKDQSNKLIFDCEQYYQKDKWFTSKKLAPRFISFLKRIISLIKNGY